MTRYLPALVPLLSAGVVFAGPDTRGGGQLPDAKPVSRFQVVPLPGGQASVRRDGRELTRYHFGDELDRPFFFPLRTLSGNRSVTRMGHPHDPVGHSHHNSVWISHHAIAGTDFWGDIGKSGTGRVRHQRVVEFRDGETSAAIISINHWQTEKTRVVHLVEKRTATVMDDGLGGGDGWFLVLDLEFNAPGAAAATTVEKTPFGFVGVRMAKTIGVHDGGGRILSSGGGINEDAIFRKPARWVDYSGRLTDTSTAGITLCDHPDNPGHPTPFHVRDDGWMGACATLDTEIVVDKRSPLHLRYGLWIHDGTPSKDDCRRAWERFVACAGRGGEPGRHGRE